MLANTIRVTTYRDASEASPFYQVKYFWLLFIFSSCTNWSTWLLPARLRAGHILLGCIFTASSHLARSPIYCVTPPPLPWVCALVACPGGSIFGRSLSRFILVPKPIYGHLSHASSMMLFWTEHNLLPAPKSHCPAAKVLITAPLFSGSMFVNGT